MWNRDEYPQKEHFVEEHFKLNTSSLIPKKPKILYISADQNSYNPKINFHFKSNVAEDESSFFVGTFVIETNFALTQSLCLFQIFKV